MRCEHNRHIGQQGQRCPFEKRRIARVANEDFKSDTEGYGINLHWAADEEAQSGPHGAEISSEIDDVGHNQECHDPPQEPGRAVPSQILGDPEAGDRSDARTLGLDSGHQWKS